MTWRPRYKGDFLQGSRDRVSAGWKRAGWRYARGVARFAAFGPGAVAAAGLANYFSSVPRLKGDPRVSMPRMGIKRQRIGQGQFNAGHQKDDPTPYTQYALSKRKSGRNLPKAKKITQLISALTQPIVTRWQNIAYNTTGMDAASGVYPLNFQITTGTGVASKYPYYLFDLTGLPNNKVSPGGTYGTTDWPMVASRLIRYRNDTSPTEMNNQYDFEPIVGSAAGVGALSAPYSWLYERKPRQVFPMGNAMLDWVDIRLQFYGATAKPSRVTIKLVSFTDEDLVPAAWVGASQTAIPVKDEDDAPSLGILNANDDIKKWNEYHLGAVDALVSTPIQKRDHLNLGSRMKVLYSESIDINPTTTTESDARGHIKALKIFRRMNRSCRFDWQAAGVGLSNPGGGITGVAPINEGNPNWFDSTRSDAIDYNLDVKPYCDKKKRVYLMITGQSAVAGAFSAASHSSFDVMIRRRHSVIGHS